MRMRLQLNQRRNHTMMTLTLIPLATATTQTFAVRITEGLCRPYSPQSSMQPIVSVDFSVENPKNLDGQIVASLVARGTITYVPKGSCPCKAVIVPFVEKATIAFTANGTNTISVVKGDAVIGEPSNVRCNAYGYTINTTITTAIA